MQKPEAPGSVAHSNISRQYPFLVLHVPHVGHYGFQPHVGHYGRPQVSLDLTPGRRAYQTLKLLSFMEYILQDH